MIERRGEQRLDLSREGGARRFALPSVVVRLAIPGLQHRKAAGAIGLPQHIEAQHVAAIGLGGGGAILGQHLPPRRSAPLGQELDIGHDVEHARRARRHRGDIRPRRVERLHQAILPIVDRAAHATGGKAALHIESEIDGMALRDMALERFAARPNLHDLGMVRFRRDDVEHAEAFQTGVAPAAVAILEQQAVADLQEVDAVDGRGDHIEMGDVVEGAVIAAVAVIGVGGDHKHARREHEGRSRSAERQHHVTSLILFELLVAPKRITAPPQRGRGRNTIVIW